MKELSTITEKRPTQLTKGKNLKGYYLLTVQKQDGSVLKDIPAATDWGEANFKKEVLASAQNAFFQSMTKFEVISMDGVKKRSNERGYVNVEDEQVLVKIKNDTINMLRYCHPKKMVVGDQYKKIEVSNHGVKWLEYAYDNAGNRIKLDKSEKQEIMLVKKWVGYCRATRRAYSLSTEFDGHFLNLVFFNK